MIVSLNYQRLYDFNRRWDLIQDMNDPFYTTPVLFTV